MAPATPQIKRSKMFHCKELEESGERKKSAKSAYFAGRAIFHRDYAGEILRREATGRLFAGSHMYTGLNQIRMLLRQEIIPATLQRLPIFFLDLPCPRNPKSSAPSLESSLRLSRNDYFRR